MWDLGGSKLPCGLPRSVTGRVPREAGHRRGRKLGIVEEECDEAIYWLEMLVETDLVKEEKLADLVKEANELLAIVVTSIITSKRNN